MAFQSFQESGIATSSGWLGQPVTLGQLYPLKVEPFFCDKIQQEEFIDEWINGITGNDHTGSETTNEKPDMSDFIYPVDSNGNAGKPTKRPPKPTKPAKQTKPPKSTKRPKSPKPTKRPKLTKPPKTKKPKNVKYLKLDF